MKKCLIIILIFFIINLLYACKIDTQHQNNNEGTENWAGESLVKVDLGDCIIDAYPYDEMYDWGQSIIYDEGKYKMWWCRQSPHDTIWYAESTDMKVWSNAKKIIQVEENSSWIKMHVGKPTIIKVNKEYIMYFEAPATLVGLTESDNNILKATSQDGINWQYYTAGTDEAQPVIKMDEEQMNKGNYGIGQPSALYKDGTYYLYYTYSVGSGDKMYLSTSTDGINFTEGIQVFTRASCGVKFSSKLNKFILAYEYTQKGNSSIYYMESDDGINFTYSYLVGKDINKNVLSSDIIQVRGYADFVGNAQGIVDNYTFYVAYMEGNIAEFGDWRKYSNTWDIHISAFNVKEYAKKTIVLPDGNIYNEQNIQKYKLKHIKYDTDLYTNIYYTNEEVNINGKEKSFWNDCKFNDITRTSFSNGRVPTNTKGNFRAKYNYDSLFLLINVTDNNINQEDYISFLIKENSDLMIIKIYQNENYTIEDTNGKVLDKKIDIAKSFVENGYDFEVRYNWDSTVVLGKEIAFDVYIFDNSVKNINSALAWNNFKISYNILGSLILC